MSKRTTKKAKPSPPSADSPKPEKPLADTAAAQDAKESGGPKKPTTILSEAFPPFEDIGELFRLYRNADGSPRVEFSQVTEQRSQRLLWKLDEDENALVQALVLTASFENIKLPALPEPRIIVPFGGSNVHEVHRAASEIRGLCEIQQTALAKINQTIAKDIELIADSQADAKARKKARRRAEKTFSNALEALEKKSNRKAHESAATVSYRLENGEVRNMPLAWVALEIARQLVWQSCILQRQSALPTKRQVQTEIEWRYPECQAFSQALWSKAWTAAGLDVLPKDKAWTEDESVKSRRRKARKQKRQGHARKDNYKQ